MNYNMFVHIIDFVVLAMLPSVGGGILRDIVVGASGTFTLTGSVTGAAAFITRGCALIFGWSLPSRSPRSSDR